MNRKPFTPQPGTGYWNQGGGTFDCLSVLDDGRAVMRNRASGWTLENEEAGGGEWSVPSRPRELTPTQLSLFPQKQKYPTEKKKRYGKTL